MKGNLYGEIRRTILSQELPFCISDLYDLLESLTDDRDLILEILNELYDRRLIDYRAIEEGRYAFVVA